MTNNLYDDLKLGSKVELSENAKNILEALNYPLQTAGFTFRESARMLREVRIEMFDAVREIHPQLDDFEFTIDHRGKTITITSHRRE
jgi:cytidylate kinase